MPRYLKESLRKRRHSQLIQHNLHSTGLNSRIICIQHVSRYVHTRGSSDCPCYHFSNTVNIANVKGKKQGGQGAILFAPTSQMHTSSFITVLQDILIMHGRTYLKSQTTEAQACKYA